MGTVTLERIHEDLMSMKKEIHEIKSYLAEESLELTEGTKKQIRESRKRDEKEFVSQEDVERKHL